MTDKKASDDKARQAEAKKETKGLSAEEKAEYNRISPDKPYGLTSHEEEDFYQRQREQDPDGMTPAERNQHQMAAPGALKQESPAGEKLGDPDAEQPKPTEQSKG